jgi:transposase
MILKIDPISLNKTISDVEKSLAEDPQVSPTVKSAVSLLIVVVKMMAGHFGLDSANSSKPPSSDPLRKRKNKAPCERKPGGQPNHIGSTLMQSLAPDKIKLLKVKRRQLPKGDYTEQGYEARQVIDLQINRVITEYRAQILFNEKGQRFVAEFPAEVTRPVQYGASVKSNAVGMSMFQLIPYDRLQTQFAERFNIALSIGSLNNFNVEAYERLELFESLAKLQLAAAHVLHVDETGININGKRLWLHAASSDQWTLFYPHEKRGKIAMDEMGVLPNFKGTAVHDHWKPYYLYTCLHSLCNAHHLRELTYAFEKEGQQWAHDMQLLLLEIKKAVDTHQLLQPKQLTLYRRKYRAILRKADAECPNPATITDPPKNGRIKRSKSRNLLERLRKYEQDVLRFMTDVNVPFTNNLGERDLRMTKVQQKISGCFRSMDGAKVFCRIRSYLSTCRKHGIGVGHALDCLFNGTWPDFILQIIQKNSQGAE